MKKKQGLERRSDVFVFGAKRRKAKTASWGRGKIASAILSVTKSHLLHMKRSEVGRRQNGIQGSHSVGLEARLRIFSSPRGRRKNPIEDTGRVTIKSLMENMERYNRSLAYIVGVALGDGNLSNPNKRAVRLRVTCDAKYPNIIKRIIRNIKIILPNNQISPVIRSKQNCVDVSCYSNQWEQLLGWKAKNGSKAKQKISVPKWIQENPEFTRLCLKGLFETDGSVYLDRGYTMVNFVSIIPTLVRDVENMIHSIGFISNTQKFKEKTGSTKHTIRVSKNAKEFIKKIQLHKS